MNRLTTELLLAAYAQGFFPMAKSRDATVVEWYHPQERGIIPLDEVHIPKSLAKLARKAPYRITMNQNFHAVISACANTARGHEKDTWINDEIIASYCELHRIGHAHSVEVWTDSPTGEEALVGGLYGVSLGSAFFGESMFSTLPNASKLALVHLVAWLRANHYTLLDTQYVNEHLLQFGVKAIAREEYLKLLKAALKSL